MSETSTSRSDCKADYDSGSGRDDSKRIKYENTLTGNVSQIGFGKHQTDESSSKVITPPHTEEQTNLQCNWCDTKGIKLTQDDADKIEIDGDNGYLDGLENIVHAIGLMTINDTDSIDKKISSEKSLLEETSITEKMIARCRNCKSSEIEQRPRNVGPPLRSCTVANCKASESETNQKKILKHSWRSRCESKRLLSTFLKIPRPISDTQSSTSGSWESCPLPVKRSCLGVGNSVSLQSATIGESLKKQTDHDLILTSRTSSSNSVPRKKIRMHEKSVMYPREITSHPSADKCIQCNIIDLYSLTERSNLVPLNLGADSRTKITTLSTSTSYSKTMLTSSSISSVDTDLCLNLPCSIQENSSSSSFPTPIEPKVVILSNLDSQQEENTNTSAMSSSNLDPASFSCRIASRINTAHLERISPKFQKSAKYFVTNMSPWSSEPSQATQERFSRSVKSNDKEDEHFQYNFGLNLPKRLRSSYAFPAFTKITSTTKNIDDEQSERRKSYSSNRKTPSSRRRRIYSNETSVRSSSVHSTYKQAGLLLMNSPTHSPKRNLIRFKQREIEEESKTTSSDQDSPRNLLDVRRTQSTDVGFYSVPSPSYSGNSSNVRHFRDGISDSNVCRTCFCIPKFFRRKKCWPFK